ncbi:MAG TPA: hypothetical protein VK155_16730 [Bacteroidales bacterium]|jgi:capsular polysaccharide biosynthesis protein|nr:hypothetical protein [Bacteroidales bacterium]
MTTENIIILILIIIAGILLIKFIAKALFRLLIFLLIIGAVVYFIFFNKSKEEDRFILQKLQQKYCIEKYDSVKCQCIIDPLITDLNSKYTTEEVRNLSRDPVKTAEAMIKLLNDNNKEIRSCLKSRNALHAWDDFLGDIKSMQIGEKLNAVIENIK